MKNQGSVLVLVLWIIFFFPIAIWYFMSRSWADKPNTSKKPSTSKPKPKTKRK